MNLYNSIAHFTFLFLKVYALFNAKIKLFVDGRKKTFQKLSVFRKKDKIIWFHTASLGEFEQGRPVIEEIKRKYSDYKILITFFSPSGYEIRKNYELADVVCYLPFDTKKKVSQFINVIRPKLAIIIKYEFWPNLLHELKRQAVSTLLLSGIFRKNQIFFTPFGKWMKNSLEAFDHFFVQDEASKKLLAFIHFNNVSVSGDTRFDRVTTILEQHHSIPSISTFKNHQYTVVAGSTWPEDEALLVRYINDSEDEKFIIAPHNIHSAGIQKLTTAIQKKTLLFSEKDKYNLSEYQVLIVDTIGLLAAIYSYADTAYIGGGFKKGGLHNILEPATFGIPVVIGPQFSKFKEAVDLVALKGCFSVKNQQELSSIFRQLKSDKKYRKETGDINQEYVRENKGATNIIMDYISKKILPI
ncbi:MAG: 3-deoxy-D-manno-octulosonic acid transferase [Flavobacteriaceae bacterium]|nr:MAG: 3-deoxy-D-manno-octulosonic acid transferase [Flavobacteriaceae bacterium]